jgi:alpha-beta hydrolase superfamily lysophospholipase
MRACGPGCRQWSYDDSRADGPRCAARVTVPTLVVENGADDACTPSHTARIWAGLRMDDRERHRVAGATHYYLGQRAQLAEATGICVDWLLRRGFLDA